jgi:hypothetical protein
VKITGSLEVDPTWRTIIWQQFGATIDMLENALHACPDDLWSDRSQRQEFWYIVYHTLFWLDLYLTGSLEGFAPPAPFTLDELDPAGVLPERPYTKAEMQTYLDHGREKCRTTIAALTDEQANRPCKFSWMQLSFAELLLDNMRPVQYHAAELNVILGDKTGSAPNWVTTTKRGLNGY